MRSPRATTLTVAAALCPALALPAGAESKPKHVHYADSPATAKPAPGGALAPRLQRLGDHTFPVTTKSQRAQLFIDQGVNLAYGFNHAEAGRSFREAARLDPDCAMAYWGEALVLGPNINAPMNPDDEAPALAAVQKALARKDGASDRERAYIEALALRYTGNPDDRGAADRAYADAMRAVAARFPEDLDAATFFAESLMDLRPWNYWSPDGVPYPETREIVAALESVLSRDSSHPGANHYYIHTLEATDTPEKAEAAADRLRSLMPGAGHMVHMPSHIYERVGRYADASAANENAILADEDYISQCRAQGLYPMAYYPHNIHFLWSAATMEGRSARAIEAARKVAAQISDQALADLPILAGFRVIPYYALTRFGHWDEMLAEPPPPAGSVYLEGTWHYARGIAFVGKGDLGAAEAELAHVRRAAADPSLETPLFSPNLQSDILGIAPPVLEAAILAKRKEYGRAIALLDEAARLEDGLVYTEPEEWHYPVRQLLGSVLLEAGRPREAQTVYWEDLKRHPENGWSLFGLARALETLGKAPEAEAVRARFARAWSRADVTLEASRF
jgi:tetratricopeptide (TPR) repeat protein